MEKKTFAITGNILKATAAILWMQLVQFKDLTMPKWSNGWLAQFKWRYGIRQHTLHGESSSVNTDYVMRQLAKLHEKLWRYSNCDIYNMDETALYVRTECIGHR